MPTLAKWFQVLKGRALRRGGSGCRGAAGARGRLPPFIFGALHAAGRHFGFDEGAAYAFVVCPCVVIVHGHAVGAIEVDSFDAPEGNGGAAGVAVLCGGFDFFGAGRTFGQGLGFYAGGAFGQGFLGLHARRRDVAFGRGGCGCRGGTAAVVATGVECGGAERGCNCKNLCA